MAPFDPAMLKGKLTDLRRNFTPGQMTVAGLLTAGLVGGSAAFYSWISAPSYQLLYGSLSSKDAASVISKLQGDNVPYQLSQGGTAILVPAANVDQERISLSAAGLPTSGSPGYELLDNQSLTTSSFMEQLDAQRALEGELDRTLDAMDGIQSATVHLVPSQDQLYSNGQTAATASVLLTTSTTLSDDQVNSVVHLVAAAVRNLDPGSVTVTDQNGNLLSDSGSGNSSTHQLKLQNAVQAELSTQADTMLTQVLGPNKAIVRVNADLDFDQHAQQSETYDPSHQAILSQQGTGEQYSGANNQAAGALTSAPTPSASTGTSGSGNYNQSSSQTQYGVSRILSQDTSTPGKIKRLTAAVVLDQAAAQNTSPQQVQALVAAALGMDPSRGDSIVVSTAKFDTSTQTAADQAAKDAQSAKSSSALMQQIEEGAGAGVLLLTAAGLVFTLRRRVRPVDMPVDPASVFMDGMPVRSTVTEPEPERLESPDEEVELSRLSPAELMLRRIDRHPDKVAAVLRAWMAEDK